MSIRDREESVPQRTESGAGRSEVETVRLSGQEISALLHAVLESGAPFTFRAAGGSMFPFIRDGDQVALSSLHACTPRLGDVVACTIPGGGKLVIHRVVGRRADGYLIRGDAAPHADGWVDEQAILGQVTGVVRRGKKQWLGLGRERVLVAALTRSGLLPRLFFPFARLICAISRRSRPSSSANETG
jgi:hypothetical protein